MDYDDRASAWLDIVYSGADVTAQRADTLQRLALRPGEHVLDVGSGPGFLVEAMAGAVGPQGRVRGIDISEAMIRRSAARSRADWASFAVGDATDLQEADAAYDVVVSTQVAEYIPDIDGFCRELSRVMAPGGRGLVIATDWDGVIWYSEEPARMARFLKAFEGHCADPRLPRHLAPRLRQAGLDVSSISSFPLLNFEFREGAYSHGIAGFLKPFLVRKRFASEAEVSDWAAEQEKLSAEGRYFFASQRFIFEIAKPA